MDKLLHALVGFVIVVVANAVAGPLWALGACFVAAAGKELYDAHHPGYHTAESADFLATVSGGIVALLFVG